jgi:hypothetical protein
MSQKQEFIFLFLLILFTLLGLSLAHKKYHCSHEGDKKDYMGPDLKLSRFERKMRQSAKLYDSPIRIHLDYSNLDSVGRDREYILKIISKEKIFFFFFFKFLFFSKQKI